MVVLVLMAALVRSYDTHAPGRTRPDEQGEYNEQRKQLLCDGWAHLISQDR
jgi:hypothetical protein